MYSLQILFEKKLRHFTQHAELETEVFTKASYPHIPLPSSVGYGTNQCKPGPCGKKHPMCIIITTETVQPLLQGT